ncbi:MAG: TIGR03960 family B12-binding radical SAM protein, partial [Candidatus Gastranaerophilaceae bacterium]
MFKEATIASEEDIQDFKNKIFQILKQVNKPSRYIGQETGSIQKNWDDCDLKTCILFPDMYEVAVSNLGHRILYHIINNQVNCLADRTYAPAIDFREKLKQNNLSLYGVDYFKKLSDYDVIAVSLQYELSYPTLLEMLDMGGIKIKNSERDNNAPIIIAGGPGCYNPEPLTEFIDAFIIGDGEDILPEILEKITQDKKLSKSRENIIKNLAQIEGIYVPSLNNGHGEIKIKKRTSNLEIKNVPVNFPVPYSPSVHDRAVVEIRRGCGRMCRFCQACYVNLPVREQASEYVVKLVDNSLCNTGYEEYSLLSLSSNDYTDMENLVKVLNNKHARSGASISLPSQRADSFSLELAQEVQKVRKSTLTFAPEAGSQRLRDVINKNLTQEQVFDAVISAYKAGWHGVKLYFMIGLPTETFEDLDEIINLLTQLKYKASGVKRELDLKKHLDLTCTVSIFVPKPFTPFQWFAQDSMELINEKITYLKQKARALKGVKLNFHDSFLCKLEAVFARGDSSLNKLIEAAWQ